MIKENTTLEDIDLNLVSKEMLEMTRKETEAKYLACFVNIALYDYLIDYMSGELENEEEENKKQLENSIESERQKKLATIKMIENHRVNLESLDALISKK